MQKSRPAKFISHLADIYYAEKQLVRALPKLARLPLEGELRGDFESPLVPTEVQVQKVETVFAGFGEQAPVKKCQAIVGILEEGDQMASQNQGSPAFDADRFFRTLHGEGIIAGRLGKSAPRNCRDKKPQPGALSIRIFPT
jgi:ferritin-like metal-binding protein YciE